MPRTRKQVRKTSVIDPKIRLVEFHKSYKHQIKTFDADMKISMAMLQSILKSSRKLISPEIGNRLYEDVVKECLNLKDNAMVDASITSTCDSEFKDVDAHSSTLQASSDVPDDAVPSKLLRIDSIAIADSTSRHVDFAEMPPSTVSKKWKTPAVNHMDPGCSAVTPKVNPEECVSVLRFPAQGEMAISMKGSPLLVSSHVSQNTVNLQVPLPNGRVLSIQPMPKFNLYDVPEIDPATRRQLMTITEHINLFVAMTDKVKRPKKN